MAISASLLPEFDHEMVTTRKVIERVPADKFGYKPHERSMTMGALAGHIAEMPGWAVAATQADSLDMAAYKPPAITTPAEVLSTFDKNVAAARAAIAAAIEQLEVWAQRTGADLIRQQPGSDPSAVAFDAVQAAKARRVDYVIVDTAGRLHNKTNLMAELEKMRRTFARVIPEAPHQVLLVIEATTGQNGLEQARKFTETSAVTGIILTKLDGTAKGGVVVAISRELNLPIRYVGVGEQIDDLLPFDPAQFVASLFD